MMTTLQMVFAGLILVWLGFGFLGALQLEAQKLAWAQSYFSVSCRLFLLSQACAC